MAGRARANRRRHSISNGGGLCKKMVMAGKARANRRKHRIQMMEAPFRFRMDILEM
jgi:hypothetical protein